MYADYDVFLFPGLHDTGANAVIEAMFNELPVICLDCGGPAVAVRGNCGIKVPLGRREKVIGDLAAAIRWYNENRAAVLAHAKAAREAVLTHYDWDKKGTQMNERYWEAVQRHSLTHKAGAGAAGCTGTSGLANLYA